jgi:hypothetical protein
MDSKNRNIAIRDLHKICQEEYGAPGFFEHVNTSFEDIAKAIELPEETEEGE